MGHNVLATTYRDVTKVRNHSSATRLLQICGVKLTLSFQQVSVCRYRGV